MQLQKKSAQALCTYVHNAIIMLNARSDMRHNFEYIDREYARTNDRREASLQARRKQRNGDKTILQDITVPVIHPQTDSAHAYLSSVFLSGYPIFQTVASPENSVAADMMDAVNSDHQTKGQWVRNLGMALRDGLKYNLMAVEVVWEKRRALGLQREEGGDSIAPKAIQWEGNVIKRISPYNCFFDVRVPPADVARHGEFAGHIEVFSTTRFKEFLSNLPEEGRQYNGKEALECGEGQRHFYVPLVTDKQEIDPARTSGFNWGKWAGDNSPGKLNYKDSYEITTMYARIIPEEFGIKVAGSGMPQIWKFIYVNNTCLIYAEKLNNAHGLLPMLFGSPIEDGMDYQTLSFSENLLDIQGMASALWNIRIAGARRTVGDRLLYNPEFIKDSDINSSNPAAKIPVRPNRYLDNLSKAVYQFPFETNALQSVIPDAMNIMEFGRSVSGISKPFEGQFLKGNRTLGEYEDVRGNADSRLQTLALFIQDQFIVPLKEVIKVNVLQFQKPGTLYFSVKSKNVGVNPRILQDVSLDFRMSDGLLPTSKLADTAYLQQLLNFLSSNPEAQAQFDVVKLLDYISSLRNVPGLSAFARTQPLNVPDPQQNPAAPAVPNGIGIPQ